ncbi:MAG: heavy metal translocating P-type ATPase, partial [Oscillospiraceae bacterium]|nr:heavy metal translocating P-type ATPase [Oscillospiraceae bacterium]
WSERKQQYIDSHKKLKKRLLLSVILLIPLMYIAMGEMMGLPVPSIFIGMDNHLISAITQFLISLAIIAVNSDFFTKGFKALLKRSPNMDSLIAVGSSAALIYGIFAIYRMAYGYGHGNNEIIHHYAHQLYFESAAMVPTLVTVGKFLENRSKSKTSDAIEKLMNLTPKTAVVIRGGNEITIPSEKVVKDDILIIRPGESIPVDGIITEGQGYVDQSAVTGESIPVGKNVGDEVISATINKNGTFRMKASKVGNDTTIAQIIRLVDEAGNSKAPISRLADKISGFFVPAVMLAALVVIAVWLFAGESFEFAFSCGISVLVISCPCALGLATPVSVMAGTGKAAEYGIIIRSAEGLENLHKIDTIVLDKTGTITTGHPSVTDIIVSDNKLTKENFAALAAAAEYGNNHPIAEAITEYAANIGLKVPNGSNYKTFIGEGISAEINGKNIFAGNMFFIKKNVLESDDENKTSEIVNKLADEGKTPVIFSDGRKIIGIIAVSDTIRKTSIEAVRILKDMGIRVVMLTGDNSRTANAVAKLINADEVISEVRPEDKEKYIRKQREQGYFTAMTGDGINDSPALAGADVGIAIGSGTDIAIDSADVILMKDSLMDVVNAIDLSKAVMRNIKMNLFWAFFYNILCIPLAAGVFYLPFEIKLNPMIGSAAMSISSVCVVLNALRLRFFKINSQNANYPENKNVLTDSINTNNNNNEKGVNAMKKVLVVDGMMCGHCVQHVQKALTSLSGIKDAEVNLEKKTAEVVMESDISDDILINAVTEAGYTVLSCNKA